MLHWLTPIFGELQPQTQGAVLAAFVAAIASLIASIVSWRVSHVAAAASKEAARISATATRESARLASRLDRLLVPVVAAPTIEAMKSLWEITGQVPRSYRATPLDLNERKKFVGEITDWYYTRGNGLFLSPDTRDALFRVRCWALRPREAEVAGLDLQYEIFFLDRRKDPESLDRLKHPESDDELATNLRNELSTLREKIKQQLGIYGIWNEPK
jgi:hypothetical protein